MKYAGVLGFPIASPPAFTFAIPTLYQLYVGIAKYTGNQGVGHVLHRGYIENT
jgi:hypothetical protein